METLIKIPKIVPQIVSQIIKKTSPVYILLASIIFSNVAPTHMAQAVNVEQPSSIDQNQKPAILALTEIQPITNQFTDQDPSDQSQPIMVNNSVLIAQNNLPETENISAIIGNLSAMNTTDKNLSAKTAVADKFRIADNSDIKIADKIADKTVTVRAVKKNIMITAYSSTPDQTDNSPFITANGKYVHDGIVACNFLPFGTKVRLPDIYGDKVFVVEDRMAKHNSDKVDIWMQSRTAALQFGVKRSTLEILD